MSLVFKLTIPDGALARYLSTMTSKARNFEIVRLATNDLIRMQQPQSRAEDESSFQEDSINQNESEQPDGAYPPSYIGMQNHTEKPSESEDFHEAEDEAESLSSNRVDFGSEILDIN